MITITIDSEQQKRDAARDEQFSERMAMDSPVLRGFVVLAVDDDPDNLAVSTAALASFGCSVLAAEGVDDALAILDSGAHVDVVFSDVVMPKANGVVLARIARERRPGLPVVLATGYPEALDGVTESGAISLIKPYSMARLEAVLAESLHLDAEPPGG